MSNHNAADMLEFIYGLAGFLGALATIPQAIKVWHTHVHHVDAMSLITWSSYLLISVIGVMYGVVHNQPAVIFSGSAYVVVYAVVVLGVALETRTFW